MIKLKITNVNNINNFVNLTVLTDLIDLFFIIKNMQNSCLYKSRMEWLRASTTDIQTVSQPNRQLPFREKIIHAMNQSIILLDGCMLSYTCVENINLLVNFNNGAKLTAIDNLKHFILLSK